MKLYLILLIAPLALAGHWSACVVPGGSRNSLATSDCCQEQVKHGFMGVDYSKEYNDCRSYDPTKPNLVDSGAFAKCCTNHGYGSVGE